MARVPHETDKRRVLWFINRRSKRKVRATILTHQKCFAQMTISDLKRANLLHKPTIWTERHDNHKWNSRQWPFAFTKHVGGFSRPVTITWNISTSSQRKARPYSMPWMTCATITGDCKSTPGNSAIFPKTYCEHGRSYGRRKAKCECGTWHAVNE